MTAGVNDNWQVVVHGGAGAMRTMGSAREVRYRQGLLDALYAGANAFEQGGTAISAALSAVATMERSGAFNAGLGSCLNSAGHVEIDAAVMQGSDRTVGSVAAVPGVANGVELAEAVRSQSPHAIFAGSGALEFAASVGFQLSLARPKPERVVHYRELVAKRGPQTLETDLTDFSGTHDEGDTVGAITRDTEGRLAVAVSTGGTWLKAPGRVGDSPIPGAGFWVDDGVGAAVATGTGDYLIRTLISRRAVELMQQGLPSPEAGQAAIDELGALFGPGKGGLLVVDAQGRVGMPFDTRGMGRGLMQSGGEPTVSIWPDEGALRSS